MTAAERLKDALKVGGKIRGHRVPQYDPEGKLLQYCKQLVEIVAGDVIEICALCDPSDEIATVLMKGAKAGAAERHITIYADDLYHILDQAAGKKPLPPQV